MLHTYAAPCLWYHRCNRRAATWRWHPILGSIPICHRCAAKLATQVSVTREPLHQLACAIELTVGYERHRRCTGHGDSKTMRERWQRITL